MHKKNRPYITILLVALMAIAWIAVLAFFSGATRNGLHNYSLQYFESNAADKAALLDGTLNAAARSLRAAASRIGGADAGERPALLRACREGMQAEGMLLLGADGGTLESEGAGFTPPPETVSRALGGRDAYAVAPGEDGKPALLLLTPVYGEGRAAGALCVLLQADEAFALLLPETYGGHYLIADSGGTPLFSGDDDPWWTEQGAIRAEGGLDPRLTDALKGADGKARQVTLSASCFAVSKQLSVSGWQLFYLAPEAAFNAGFAFVDNNFLYLSIATAGMCMLGFVCLLIYSRGNRRSVQEEKDRLAWLEERYRIIARESEDVILEISLKEKSIEANENFVKLFGYNISQWNREYIKQVHPDDAKKFTALYEGIKAGKRIMKEDMRIRRADGSYIWCRMLIAILFNSSGKPARVLGKITNIDMQRREADWLKQRAQQDSLTNIFNKDTTHNSIRHFLEAEGREGVHGLMVLDVDDFKQINDTRGHLQGDTVLKVVAEKLRMQFRSTDIVGRIGGDEFMVFLKNVNSRAQLSAQTEALLYAYRGNADAVGPISISIGAALYPDDGDTLETLYNNADRALYRAKKLGKNRFAVYGAAQADLPDNDG